MARHHFSRCAFTLLELMTVVVIISILVVMLMPMFGQLRARAQKIQCMANLRNLYYGASCYVQQNGKWPQISPQLLKTREYDSQWIAALEPFYIQPRNWICPTVQAGSGDPDFTQSQFARVDYVAMPFDDKPMTPYRSPDAPWFVEKGDLHGNGNLMIFTDGSIKELNEFKKP